MTSSASREERPPPDPRSFDDFFADHARAIAAAVAVATGDVALAEDVTQEAMARAAQRWRRVSRMERPDLWVLHVARRLAVDAWRKRRRETALDEGDAHVPDEVERLWVQWGLQQMTPQERMLVILRHVEGRSVDEIAHATGHQPSTVTTYLKRARRRLRALLSMDSP